MIGIRQFPVYFNASWLAAWACWSQLVESLFGPDGLVRFRLWLRGETAPHGQCGGVELSHGIQAQDEFDGAQHGGRRVEGGVLGVALGIGTGDEGEGTVRVDMVGAVLRVVFAAWWNRPRIPADLSPRLRADMGLPPDTARTFWPEPSDRPMVPLILWRPGL